MYRILCLLLLLFSCKSIEHKPNSKVKSTDSCDVNTDLSPKMKYIYDQLLPKEKLSDHKKERVDWKHSSIPFDDALTCKNRIQAPIMGATAIFDHIANMIRTAEKELLIQLFEWHVYADMENEKDELEGHVTLMNAIKARSIDMTRPVLDLKVIFLKDPAKKPYTIYNKVINELRDNGELGNRVNLDVSGFPFFAFGALHSKVIIKDGVEALTTGVGVTRWFQSDGHWYELATPHIGEVAESLRKEYYDTHLLTKMSSRPEKEILEWHKFKTVVAASYARFGDDYLQERADLGTLKTWDEKEAKFIEYGIEYKNLGISPDDLLLNGPQIGPAMVPSGYVPVFVATRRETIIHPGLVANGKADELSPAQILAKFTEIVARFIANDDIEVDKKVDHPINNPQDIAFVAAMESAQPGEVVKLLTPNLNDPDALKHLIIAAKRGVKFQILLPKNFNAHNKNASFNAGLNIDRIKDLQIALHNQGKTVAEVNQLLDIRWFKYEDENGNWQLFVDQPHNPNPNRRYASHAKYFSVAGQIMISGSGNWDQQAWKMSREVNTIIDSPEVTQKYDEIVFDRVFVHGEVVNFSVPPPGALPPK